MRGHRPLLLTVSAFPPLDTLVPTWDNSAPTLIFFLCFAGLQRARGGTEGPAHGAEAHGDLGGGGHRSGAPQLDEEPAPDASTRGRYFSIYIYILL